MKIQLDNGWQLNSAENAKTHGETISLAKYPARSWTPAVVPGTVVGGLVKSGKLPDPNISLAIESFEGFKGGNQKLHTLMPMPDDSPYRKPWWFRNVFNYRKPTAGRKVWLELEGVNNAANVWLNGKRIGTSRHIGGVFKRTAIDITTTIMGGKNCLALELSAGAFDDFGHTWIDWAPEPPDNSMGIIQPVVIRETDNVTIKHPFVQSDLDVKSLKNASLDIRATLQNTSDEPAVVELSAKIGQVVVRETFHLGRWEQREVVLQAKNHRGLNIKNPRVWWPYQMGKPELYTLSLKAKVGKTISDSKIIDFGIRKITSKLNRHGARLFNINGQDMLIRGSAWSPDLFLGQSREKDELDVAYAKNMNLNAIRLEGTPVSGDFWDVCNREGMLVLHGITCVNYWEHSKDWREEDFTFARESVKSLFASIRNNPSLMGFMIASDFPTIPKAEQMYLDLLEEIPLDVPITANSAKKYSPQLGPTGMIHGPYDFVPPTFWYQGGALHFNTECGPDICLPLIETLRETFPNKSDLKVRSHAWNMHCGLQLFTSTISGDKALTKRYGVKESDLENFVDASQVMGYECWRAMYEAWVRNYPASTGVIGWMLNSCWTSLMWQMYDYHNNPLGAFYGTQKACEPLHVQYSYDNHSIWAVNQHPTNSGQLTIDAKAYDIAGQIFWQKQTTKQLKPWKQGKCFTIPKSIDLPKLYFLVLTMQQGRKQVSRNVYWLCRDMDHAKLIANVDQKALDKPQKVFANFKDLQKLTKVKIEQDYSIKKVGSEIRIALKLQNSKEGIAFFVWPRVTNMKTGKLATPVCWSENCITLMPGEKISLTAILPGKGLKASDLAVNLTGWNIS